MGVLTYNRGTTFTLTHIYQKNGAPSSDGSELLLTVKQPQYDTDATDSNAILKKTIPMSGPSNTIVINPADIADSVTPGQYYYDIKVKETGGAIYLADSGTFVLSATPTNRLS